MGTLRSEESCRGEYLFSRRRGRTGVTLVTFGGEYLFSRRRGRTGVTLVTFGWAAVAAPGKYFVTVILPVILVRRRRWGTTGGASIARPSVAVATLGCESEGVKITGCTSVVDPCKAVVTSGNESTAR